MHAKIAIGKQACAAMVSAATVRSWPLIPSAPRPRMKGAFRLPAAAPRKPLTDPAKQKAWLSRAAIHYLSQRSASADQLRQVLARKVPRRMPEATEDEVAGLVDAVVRQCQEAGYINDAAYAEGKVASGSRRGLSRRRLGQALAAKGVEEELIRTAVADVDDARAAVIFAKRRRLGPWRTREVENALMKDVAAMARGGFSSELAFRTCKLSLEAAEELLYGEEA